MKRKLYRTTSGTHEERTSSATTAKQWFNSGKNFSVSTISENGKTDKIVFITATTPETEKEKTNRENWKHCRDIANELDYYIDGLYHICPECGERVYIPAWAEVFKCYHCGNVDASEEYDTLTLWDFFDDVFDIEFTIGSDKQYRAVRVMVACGGPNIYIDTSESAVCLYWWTDSAKYYLCSDTVDAVNDWAEDYYNCL